MGFLNKIFGKDESSTSDSNASESSERANARKESRIDLLPLHNVSFTLSAPRSQSNVQLANLSPGGAGFIKDSFGKVLDPGTEVEGTLVIEDRELPVTLRIVHTSDKVVGCAFKETSSELKKLIQKYFDMELTALEMTEVDPDTLNPDDDGKPFWIYGDNNCELFYVLKDGELKNFRLSFFGNLIEFRKGVPLRYGFTFSEDDSQNQETSNFVGNALKFVNNIKSLSPTLKDEIREIIRS